MAVYRSAMDLDLVKPIPAHALTEAAEEARQSIRRYGHRRRLEAQVSALVTEVGNPRAEPFDGDVVPAAAKRLEAKARAAGFQTVVVEQVAGCVVEGLDRERKVGFRAFWERGKAAGATWHSGGRDRFVLVHDTRPVGVNRISRTGLAGKRPAGVGAVHLKLTETPRGIPVSVTELQQRIAEHSR